MTYAKQKEAGVAPAAPPSYPFASVPHERETIMKPIRVSGPLVRIGVPLGNPTTPSPPQPRTDLAGAPEGPLIVLAIPVELIAQKLKEIESRPPSTLAFKRPAAKRPRLRLPLIRIEMPLGGPSTK